LKVKIWYSDKKNAALHRKICSTSNTSTSHLQSSNRHWLNKRFEKEEEVYLRLFLSTRALTVFVARSNVTSRIPKRCQSRSRRTRSCRTLPRPMWKHKVLFAGLICRNRESQFICISGGPVRGAVSPSFSGPRLKPERMDEELKLTAAEMSVRSRRRCVDETYRPVPLVACPCLPLTSCQRGRRSLCVVRRHS
jgi:hypothetical protein